MPVLPDASSLGQRSIPQSQRSTVSYDPSAMAKAVAGVGDKLENIGQYGMRLEAAAQEKQKAEAEKQKAADDKLALAKATLRLKRGTVDAETYMSENPNDYEKFGEVSQKIMSEAKQQSESMLSPDLQPAFDVYAQEVGLSVESAVNKTKQAVYKDKELAYFGSEREGLRQYAQKLGADNNIAPEKKLAELSSRITMMTQGLSALRDKGVISAQEHERESNSNNVAYDDLLESMNPDDAMKLVENSRSGAPLSIRNNNPGNIRGADGSFMKFATPEEGMAAMERDLTVKLSGKSGAMKQNYGEGYTPTIRTVISTYAPASENDTEAYIKTVAKETGLDPDAELSVDDVKKIMPAMIKVEGGQTASNYYVGGAAIPAAVVDRMMPQLKAARANEVRQIMNDHAAAAENGIAFSPLTDDDLSVLGDSGAVQEYQKTIETGKKVYEMQNMPIRNISVSLEASAPTSASGAALQSKQYEILRAASIKAVKAWADNPVDTAKRVDPAISGLADAAAKDPSLYPAYFKSLDDKYVEIGVNPQKNRYISEATSDQMALEMQTRLSGREDKLAVIESYKAAFGNYFKPVMTDLGDKVDTAVLAASELADIDRGLATVVANSIGVSDDDLVSKVPPSLWASVTGSGEPSMEAVEQKVAAKMELYKQSFMATDPIGGGAAADKMIKQLARASLVYVGGGKNIDDAVALAANAVNAKFMFGDGGNGYTYRVPQSKAGINIETVQQNADFIFNSIDPKKLKTDYPEEDVIKYGLPSREVGDYAASIKQGAYWVTNADDTGLMLMIGDKTPTPVLKKDNSIFEKKWDELAIPRIDFLVKKSTAAMNEFIAEENKKKTPKKSAAEIMGESGD